MSKAKAWLRGLFLMVVSVILGMNLYSWNARSLTGNVLPMPFGYGGAVVLSGSMEPAISIDDLILVKSQESYEEGDVVVYQSGRLLVVHRIVDMDGETVTTRGDANNAEDAPVDISQIKGRVFAAIPKMGALIRLLKTPAVTVALLIAAVLTIELPFRKEKEQKEEELEKIKAEIRRLKEEP